MMIFLVRLLLDDTTKYYVRQPNQDRRLRCQLVCREIPEQAPSPGQVDVIE